MNFILLSTLWKQGGDIFEQSSNIAMKYRHIFVNDKDIAIYLKS